MNTESSLQSMDMDQRLEAFMQQEISINGAVIDKDELRVELQNHPADSIEEAFQSAARALVIRELLIQKARTVGLVTEGQEVAANDLDAIISDLIEREVPEQKPDETECQRYYDANPERFCTPPLMQVRHILLAAAPDAFDDREIAKANAESVLKKLKTNPENFSPLATQFSACPSREEGGSLGQISKGQTVAEFERQLFNLPEGLAEQPIATRYGFHVVWVDHKVDGEVVPYDMAKQQVENYLTERSHRRALSQYLQRLARDADISGVDLGEVDQNLM